VLILRRDFGLFLGAVSSKRELRMLGMSGHRLERALEL
jgi:hypothetical protein